MVGWKLVIKSNRYLPADRPFIGFWRNSICLIQYDPDMEKYICSAFPVRHMHMIELHDKDLKEITHWMEMPNAPVRRACTGDARKGNYAKYILEGNDEKKMSAL